jgi:hypothetical protein
LRIFSITDMNAEERLFLSARKEGGFPPVYCIISKSN